MENAELRLEVAKLRKAIFDTHKNRVKHVDCKCTHCAICDGGLFVCADCGAAESEASERACTGAKAEAPEEPYGFAYEHDGVIYDSKCPPIFAKAQQPESLRQEPWTEIPLFTRNKRRPNK